MIVLYPTETYCITYNCTATEEIYVVYIPPSTGWIYPYIQTGSTCSGVLPFTVLIGLRKSLHPG
jgi:hypothetical protein